MKFLLPFTLLLGALAAPAPAPVPEPKELEARQLGITANDLLRGCKDVIMIWARASTEPGNIGISVGPLLQTSLGALYPGRFAMQGVDYPADLPSNFLPDGTTAQAINTMANLFNRAAQCSGAKIIGGGYSQGTAVTAGAVAKLSPSVRNRINAIVLFGYTQNAQNRGGVPGLSNDRVKVFCAIGDLVCTGTLIITASHFVYTANVPQAVAFIRSKL